jgi:hypothetical protein
MGREGGREESRSGPDHDPVAQSEEDDENWQDWWNPDLQ